jgi:transposase
MLSGYNINVELTIMDAGYYTENNVCQLISSKTAFITRIIQNSKEYKNLMENYGANLLISDNLITYGDRVLFGKKVPIILFGSQLFVYILLDLNNFTKNITKDAFQYDEDPNKSDKINDSLSSSGKFILLSNNNYEISEILPLYYTRQYIEQAFDVSNTYNNILPLRIHSKETLDGSILISFIASILYTIINNDFNKSKYSAIEAFTFMKNVRIEVFESYKIISELTKIQKDISNVLNLDVPFELEEGNRYKKNSYIAQLKNKNDKRGRPKGSKNKVKNIITDNNKKLDVTTSKRGRPKGSKNKDCLTIL